MQLSQKLSNYISICFYDDSNLILSKRNKIFIYNIKTRKKTLLYVIPCSLIYKIILFFRLTNRLFRAGVRIGIMADREKLIFVFKKTIYELDIPQKKLTSSFILPRGSRPLNFLNIQNLQGFESGIYFGEYFQNFEKKEVHIYKRTSSQHWEIVYSFKKNTIEHIHNLIQDNHNNCIWILSGDFENSSAIWMAKNNFYQVEQIVGGQQIYRSCVAFPVNGGLLYATDSQFEHNSIRYLQKNDNIWVSNKIFNLNGPAIYGCQVNENYYFSTSVEGDPSNMGLIKKLLDTKPGPGIINNCSTIIGGNIQEGFKIIYSQNKDIFPFILFQFGVFTFPSGLNNSNILFANPIALKKLKFDTLIFKNIKNDNQRRIFRSN